MAFILLPECGVIVMNLVDFLCQVLCRWRFFAGAERGSRVSQCDLNGLCGRVRTSKHASRDPFRVLARRHGLAEIVKRRAVGFVERLRVNPRCAVHPPRPRRTPRVGPSLARDDAPVYDEPDDEKRAREETQPSGSG